MKNIKDINKTIKYNKLINLIESKFKDSLKFKFDINDKQLFTVWNDLFYYYLYIGQTKEKIYYLSFDSINTQIKKTEFSIARSDLFIIDKKMPVSFWDNLISPLNFIYSCSAEEFFDTHKELL